MTEGPKDGDVPRGSAVSLILAETANTASVSFLASHVILKHRAQ